MTGVTGEYADATLPLTGAELVVVEVPSGSINLPRRVTTAQVSGYAGVSAPAGTTYTLQTSDAGKLVTPTSGSAVTVTVAAGLGAGFQCVVVQAGAGQVTLSAGAGVTINPSTVSKTASQYAAVTLIAIAADSFVLAGNAV